MTDTTYDIMKPYIAIFFIVVLVLAANGNLSTFECSAESFLAGGCDPPSESERMWSIFELVTIIIGIAASLMLLFNRGFGKLGMFSWMALYFIFIFSAALFLRQTIAPIGYLQLFLGLILVVGETKMIK
jgi:hypothetical protein